MNATYEAAGPTRTIAPPRRNSSFIQNCLNAFWDWRKREMLRADLYSLNDRELVDLGIARGEIEHIVSKCPLDPRRRSPSP
jgi:uncharacterized protein YjiS (DUF1127 family)